MTIQRKIVEKYKEEGLVIDTEDARVHRENLEHMRLGEAIQMISQETQGKIIEAYKRGDKVLDIALNYDCDYVAIYRILKFYHIPLRSQDPNHPASSLETRRASGFVPPQEKTTSPVIETVKEPVKITTPVTKSPGQIFYEKRGLQTPWNYLGKRGRERYEQKAAGTFVRKGYEPRDWGKDKVNIIDDYSKMGLRDFLKKWGLNSNRWGKLKEKWGVQNKRIILPNETSDKLSHDREIDILLRLERRLDAIDAKLSKLETIQTCPLVSIIKALNKE